MLNDPQQRKEYDDSRSGGGDLHGFGFPSFSSAGRAGSRSRGFSQRDAFSMFDAFFADFAGTFLSVCTAVRLEQMMHMTLTNPYEPTSYEQISTSKCTAACTAT